MGEAKQKSRDRLAVLKGEPRCIYCPGPPETLEHMPPVSIFRGRYRLSGMEYACCDECNQGTKAADAVAGLLSYISRPGNEKDWHADEMKRLLKAVRYLVPGFVEEIRGPNGLQTKWLYTARGLIRQGMEANGDGPVLAKHMDIFSAKLGMALYREHVGEALPLHGRVFTRWFLNSGLTDQQAEAMISIMPMPGALRMGRQHSIEQFAYRFNCDDRSIIAALAGFHSNLHVLAFATADPDTFMPIFKMPSPFGPKSLVRTDEPWLRAAGPGAFSPDNASV